MGLEKKERKNYATIISDGSIRVPSTEDDPSAVKREYETSDGKKGVKYEEVYDTLSGVIQDINFFDGDFGKVLNVTIDDITLSINTNVNFGEDFMKKLPNIDLNEEVYLSPYSFEDDKKKIRKGITVYQKGEKLQNFFFDPENKENINGYPNPEGDIKDYSKEDWKIYFMQARKFLVKYTEENIIPKIATANFVKEHTVDTESSTMEGINAKEIDFNEE